MNGAPESQRAARAAPLVGPYPIDEEALRKLKRLHDDGAIDDYTYNPPGVQGPMLMDILRRQPRTTTNLRFTQYFREKLLHAGGFRFPSAARFPPPGTSAVDSCRPM